MDTSSKYNFPWDLIAESLTGNLTAEGEVQLQQWLSSDPENKKKYMQIQELWKNGMEDYKFYKMANEKEAWNALQAKLGKDRPEQVKTKTIQVQFVQRPPLIRNIMAIAAAFLVLVGLGLWYILARNNPVIYETAIHEQKKVTLIDGSVITLQQLTKIKVLRDYYRSVRTVIMASGDAYFDVLHNTNKPFTVDLGTTRIRDIGTRFTIHKEKKKINVAVSSGKIAFVKIATQETRELKAGSGITFDLQTNRFGTIETINSSEADEQLLNFDNTSLSDVIAAIQNVYGGKIIINATITGKKFTGNLYGMSYPSVIQVVCKSMGLEYTVNDSIYILKAKNNEQP